MHQAGVKSWACGSHTHNTLTKRHSSILSFRPAGSLVFYSPPPNVTSKQKRMNPPILPLECTQQSKAQQSCPKQTMWKGANCCSVTAACLNNCVSANIRGKKVALSVKMRGIKYTFGSGTKTAQGFDTNGAIQKCKYVSFYFWILLYITSNPSPRPLTKLFQRFFLWEVFFTGLFTMKRKEHWRNEGM